MSTSKRGDTERKLRRGQAVVIAMSLFLIGVLLADEYFADRYPWLRDLSAVTTLIVALGVVVAFAFGVRLREFQAKARSEQWAREDAVKPPRMLTRWRRWFDRRMPDISAGVLFALMLVLPVLALFYFVPVLGKARELGVTPKDIATYRLQPRVQRSLGRTYSVETDTDPGEHQGHAEELRRVFPDDEEWGQVLEWARKHLDPSRQPEDISDLEAAELAWRRLNLGSFGAPVVPREELFAYLREHVPDPDERAGLLTWSATRAVYPKLFPDTDWFRLWALVEDWCPGDGPYQRRKEWITGLLGGERKFGRDSWDEFVAFGKERAEVYRKLNPAYPPDSERASVVAAIDRLTGDDGAWVPVVELDKFGRPEVPINEFTWWPMAMHIFGANDDYPFVNFGEGWTHQAGAWGADEYDGYTGLGVGLGIALLGFALQLTARLASVRGLGSALGLRNNPTFREYDRVVFDPWWQLSSTTILLGIAWAVSRWTLEPFYVLYFQSELNLALAVVWTVLIAGAMVESVENVVTLITIKRGHDPQRTLWDNVAVVVIVVPIFMLLDVRPVGVVSAMAVGMATSFAYKSMRWVVRRAA